MSKLVFTFMRCNPPTKGHSHVINLVHKISEEHNADHMIILSHSHDGRHNPLSPQKKLEYAEHYWENTNFQLSDKSKPSMIQQLVSLNQRYNELIFVCGPDRRDEYFNLMDKYNGKDFKFNSIDCIEAGSPDSRDEISSSMMRQWALDGNFIPFFFGSPKDDSDDLVKTIEMYKDVRKGLGV